MTAIYRNWAIDWCPFLHAYDAISDNYEPTWLGAEDGWQEDDANRFSANTLTEVYAEIDARIEEEAEYQAACAADAILERQWEEA